MKLAGSAAGNYFRKPDPTHSALLIFGADPMRVADKRQQVIQALVGPQGEEEMRLARINAVDLRKDPALLGDAIKAQGFFPGHRVAFVEDATDGLAKIVETALSDWQEGDAQVGPPPHQHAWDEAFFVLSGRVMFVAGEQQVELGVGDFVFVPGGTVHAYQNLEDGTRLLSFTSGGNASNRSFDMSRSAVRMTQPSCAQYGATS